MPQLRVFEHDTLRIGDVREGVVFGAAHFEALARLAARMEAPFFTLLHQAIRFRQYVGVIQAGDLTVEILPKADRDSLPSGSKWQAVLLDLLRECRLLPQHTLPPAGQEVRRHSLLEVFIHHFLEETTHLVRKGLLRAYRRETGHLPVVRGRIRLDRQLRHNAARIDRFYTEHDRFDHQHLFNELLWGALKLLRRLPLSASLRDRLEQCCLHFPADVVAPSVLPPWEGLPFTRRTERYRPALQLAWLLLSRSQPNLTAGRYPALTLLFDMNRLFEEYIFRQLHRATGPDARLLRQVQQPFWSGSRLRPDIVLQRVSGNIVLDTKWKTLRHARPDMSDLQQLYAYLHYFNAGEGALIYPQVHSLPDSVAPFHAPPSGETAGNARLIFVEVLDGQGNLNRSLGKDLLTRLGG